MGRFKDLVVLLTGAASGIGKASILRMAEEGAAVVCADIQTEAAEATAKEARELGVEAIALTLDVSDPESVRSAVAATISATWASISSRPMTPSSRPWEKA